MSRISLAPPTRVIEPDSLTTPVVDAVIERLRSCQSLVAADAECQQSSRRVPGFEALDSNRFFFSGHEILLGPSLELGSQARLLAALEVWNLKTLPAPVAEIHLNQREMVLVTRVGLPDARPLVPLQAWSAPIDPVHLAAVHADADNLASQGVTNPAFGHGLTEWCVEPSSGRIVIPATRWRMTALGRDDLAELHERIDGAAALQQYALPGNR